MADHPLRSAIDRSLGKPLPYQLANQVRAHLLAYKTFPVKAYPVLAQVSSCYSKPKGRYPHYTHPFATHSCDPKVECVRLACVRPAASVRPEPGSNSPSKSQTSAAEALLAVESVGATPPEGGADASSRPIGTPNPVRPGTGQW